MKLTRRQETFIHRLLDLYRELKGPIHYSVLAERVGVSPFTAYDMLRLLEKKGLVASEYRVASGKPVPGRSEIVFRPTDRAYRLLVELAGDTDVGDWEAVKEQVLERLRRGELHERELAEEMLARVPPEVPSILRYCIEVMTVVTLRLGRGAGRRLLAEHLPQILERQGEVTRAGLLLLSGFALGLLARESSGEAGWNQGLLAHVRRYQSLVLEMEPGLCHQLGDELKDVFLPLLGTA